MASCINIFLIVEYYLNLYTVIVSIHIHTSTLNLKIENCKYNVKEMSDYFFEAIANNNRTALLPDPKI